jgi:hypothetical protein
LHEVGRTPANPQDVVTKLTVANMIAAASPSTVSVNTEINSAAALKAGKPYVDTQNATFESPAYVSAQDALNVPLASVGHLGGVASLDATGKIPLAQVPAVGTGYVLGPYGPTAGYEATTGATPVKIADWDIGVAALTFEPVVYCTILAGAINMGRPVIEIGISNGSTSVYADQTIIARGMGRSYWNDGQVINVRPIPANDALGHSGADPTVYIPTYYVFCSAWLWDAAGETVTVAAGSVLSGAVYLWRTAE